VELLTLEGHGDEVRAVAYSPDGSRIASGSSDKTIKVWDARTGQDLLTLRGHASVVSAVAYGPDGSRLASASHDGTLIVWDARAGVDLLTLRGHKGGVLAVAFSPDGERLASGGMDGVLKVWDPPAEQERLRLVKHLSAVTQVAFSPGGRRLLSSDESGKILAWETQTGRLLSDPPTAMPDDSGPTAAFKNYRAEADGNVIRVERTLTAEEQERRKLRAAEADRWSRLDPFGAVFHLDRTLARSPGDRAELLKRRSAVLSAALKANPTDHHFARSLARQAVADFAAIDDPRALLRQLVQHPRAALDRHYGALLLRTGKAREAAVVLRAAIRNRVNDRPPIDELLLALALIRLERRDEARELLTKAAAWMDDGTAPQRLASLLVARPAGPLAALASVARVPDLRLNPLDPFTAHELEVLRREAEQALAAADAG
jgi:hypothetical protein